MEKRTLIIVGLAALVIGLIAYAFWPSNESTTIGSMPYFNDSKAGKAYKPTQKQTDNPSIISYAKGSYGNNIRGSYKIVDGKRVFIPSSVGIENINAKGKTDTIYKFASGQKVEYNEYNNIKVKTNKRPPFDMTMPTDPDKVAKKQDTSGGYMPMSAGASAAYGSADSSSQCLAVLSYIQNESQRLLSLKFDLMFTEVLGQMSKIGDFGTFSNQLKADFVSMVIDYLESPIGKIDINEVCAQMTKKNSTTADNMLFKQCVTTLQALLAQGNTQIDFVLAKLQSGINGFSIIGSSQQIQIATNIANAMYNYKKDPSAGFDINYFCNQISSLISGLLKSTDVFQQCVKILTEIQQSYNSNKLNVTKDFIMNRLMGIAGFSFVSYDKRTELVAMVHADLTDGTPMNYETLCINITAAIYDAISGSDLFKQCIGIMQDLEQLPSPTIADVESRLKTLNGFVLLASSKQQSLITGVFNDLTNGGDFNANLHCFNIVAAILDAIGSSELFQQCLSIMSEIQSSYTSQKKQGSVNEETFKRNIILTKLLKLNGFNILPTEVQDKNINAVYTDLTNGGDFNAHQLCTNIVLAIAAAITASPLYQQCLTIMDEIVTSGKKDYNFVKTELSRLTGFTILLQSQQDKFINAIIADLNDGGEFKKEQHCLSIVAAILTAIGNSALYKQCLAIMADVQKHFDNTSLTNQDKYNYIHTKLSDGLTGFSTLPDTKKQELINNTVADYNNDNKIDAPKQCLAIVLAILENKISDTNKASCVSTVTQIINENRYSNITNSTGELLEFFGNSEPKASQQAQALSLYNPQVDPESFARDICSPSINNSVASVTCITLLDKMKQDSTQIATMMDKPGYVNGIFSSNINDYQYSESLIGNALDYILNGKGTASSVCSNKNITGSNSTPPNPSINNPANTNDSATSATCITQVSALLELSSTPTYEFILTALKQIPDFTGVSPTILASNSQAIVNYYNTRVFVEPASICQISSSELESASADSTMSVTQTDLDATCKSIIYQVSRQMGLYQVDVAAIPSSDPSEIESQESVLKKSYVSNIISELDTEGHLAPATSSKYVSNLLQVHMTGLGANYSSKKFNLLNQQSKDIIASTLRDNFSTIRFAGGESQQFMINEIGKCTNNPLRTESDIEKIFTFVSAKENGTNGGRTDSSLGDTYTIIQNARKSQYYNQCMLFVNGVDVEQTPIAIQTEMKNSVNGAQAIGDGFVEKITNRIICYKQICPSQNSNPQTATSGCSNENFTCEDDTDKMNICDEYSTGVYINVPNADIVAQNYSTASICEPTDTEYVNHASTILAANQGSYVERLNEISTAALANSTATNQSIIASNNMNIQLNYILANAVFNNIYTDNLTFGLLKFNEIASHFTDNKYSYNDFIAQYYKIIGLVDSSGTSITDSSQLNVSSLFSQCTAILSNAYQQAKFNSKQADLSFITQAIREALKESNSGIDVLSRLEQSSQIYYQAKFASYVLNSSNNETELTNYTNDNPCHELTNDIFNQISAIQGFSGSFVTKNTTTQNSNTIQISSINSSNLGLSNIITNTAKQNLLSPNITVDDVDFNQLTNTTLTVNNENAQTNRFLITKTTDFINAGLSQFSDEELSAMSYNTIKTKVKDTQTQIVEEIIMATEMFDMEGKQRLCKTILDVWNATADNGGQSVSVEQCSSMLLNNWSDGACTAGYNASDFVTVCGSMGPGIRKVSSGSLCFDTSDASGLNALTKQAEEREAKAAYYNRLLSPPTNKCKCYIEMMYRLLDSKEIASYEECATNQTSYINKLINIFNGGGSYSYGQSIVSSPNNNVCKMIYSQVNEIISDNSETSRLEALFTNNEDYKNFAKQICIQKLRDLYSTISYLRKSYWMGTNVSASTGSVIKESEFTKWQNADITKCEGELEDYT